MLTRRVPALKVSVLDGAAVAVSNPQKMYTLSQLAEHVGGNAASETGIEIRGVRPFGDARPGDITLATNRKFLEDLSATNASAVIVPDGTVSGEKPLLLCSHPKAAFARILALFARKPFEVTGVSPLACVGEDCQVADEVSIGPYATVGQRVVIEREVALSPGASIGDDCRIGTGTIIHSNVTVYPGTVIGKRVTLHAGTVIGADGFGYVFDGSRQVKIPQTGTVRIEDDVEIGANSCVDRATFGETVIERGVKLDNHVHVGHNCRIGENTVIVGSVGISGSVRIGKNCVLAGQSGVADHVQIGDNVTVLARTAVYKDVPSGSTISGSYGRNHRDELKLEAALRRLPEVYKEWKRLKAKLID
jgi:UDP-3-O-[3-hydroxymyristoyl] glucosamine N-acyltransferase